MADTADRRSRRSVGKWIAVATFGTLLLFSAGFIGHTMGEIQTINGLSSITAALKNHMPIRAAMRGSEATLKGKLAGEVARRRGVEIALQRSNVQVANLRKNNCYLAGQLRHQRKLVTSHVQGNQGRLKWAIRRNAGSAAAGWIPILGDAADAGATAFDLREYYKMQNDLQTLKKESGDGLPRKQIKCP